LNARWDSPGNLEFWFHGHNLSEYETDSGLTYRNTSMKND